MILICLWFLGHVLTNAINRNVVLESETGIASGVIIETNLILTNAHVVRLIHLTVVSLDEEHDLALVQMKTGKFSRLKFATAKVGDAVFYVGNTLSHHNLVSQGHLVYKDSKHLVTDTLPGGGMSGGGLYNRHGHLVGLNEGMEGQMGVGFIAASHIPIEVVANFVERYESSKRH